MGHSELCASLAFPPDLPCMVPIPWYIWLTEEFYELRKKVKGKKKKREKGPAGED